MVFIITLESLLHVQADQTRHDAELGGTQEKHSDNMNIATLKWDQELTPPIEQLLQADKEEAGRTKQLADANIEDASLDKQLSEAKLDNASLKEQLDKTGQLTRSLQTQVSQAETHNSRLTQALRSEWFCTECQWRN